MLMIRSPDTAGSYDIHGTMTPTVRIDQCPGNGRVPLLSFDWTVNHTYAVVVRAGLSMADAAEVFWCALELFATTDAPLFRSGAGVLSNDALRPGPIVRGGPRDWLLISDVLSADGTRCLFHTPCVESAGENAAFWDAVRAHPCHRAVSVLQLADTSRLCGMLMPLEGRVDFVQPITASPQAAVDALFAELKRRFEENLRQALEESPWASHDHGNMVVNGTELRADDTILGTALPLGPEFWSFAFPSGFTPRAEAFREALAADPRCASLVCT